MSNSLKLIFIILLSTFYFLLSGAHSAQAATLYFNPSSQVVYRGDSFVVEVWLDTEGEEINAVKGELFFQNDLLEVADINKGESVLSFFAEEPKVEQGKISFIGGIPRGFNGKGLLLRIIFFGKEPGQAKINFGGDSTALLNKGSAEKANLNFWEGDYNIVFQPEGLPKITSKTHPDQNKWRSTSTLQVYWELKEGADYSYLLSYDPEAQPDEISEKPEGELTWIGAMEYRGLPKEGIYYFSLKQKLPGADWLGTARFRAMIDTTAPEDFTPRITDIEGKKYLVFSTTDKTSGIEKYEVYESRKKIFGGVERAEWIEGKSPYLLKDQELRSIIKVRAVDSALNEKVVEMTPSKTTDFGNAFFALAFLAGIGLIFWAMIKIKKRSR